MPISSSILSSLKWPWLCRGAVYMLPVNLIFLIIFVLTLRMTASESLLSPLFVSMERFQMIFRVVVFGLPFIVFTILAIMQRTSPKKFSFWIGASIVQFILFWIMIPGFNMHRPQNLNTPTMSQEENSTITPSQKRSDARGVYYETNTNGDQCAVVDLNDYIPTKDTKKKTYEWIIEFPPDDCVIQKPATNVPETLGETHSENIAGTDFRKITVSYE